MEYCGIRSMSISNAVTHSAAPGLQAGSGMEGWPELPQDSCCFCPCVELAFVWYFGVQWSRKTSQAMTVKLAGEGEVVTVKKTQASFQGWSGFGGEAKAKAGRQPWKCQNSWVQAYTVQIPGLPSARDSRFLLAEPSTGVWWSTGWRWKSQEGT